MSLDAISQRLLADPELTGVPAEPACPVPPMTHPWGKSWLQPDPSTFEFDDKHVLMRQEDFDRLLDYSKSQPSGAYEGKMWRSYYPKEGWWLHWFEASEDPKMCRRNGRMIIVL